MIRVALPFDNIGIIAGFLCAIHCIATPFLFIAKACTATCCSEAPICWIFIDYLFLIISFTAIYYTNKSTTMYWIKLSLWISWFLLGLSIVSHSFNITYLPKNFIYFPAFTIIFLHFYNLKFCKCQEDKFCSNKFVK